VRVHAPVADGAHFFQRDPRRAAPGKQALPQPKNEPALRMRPPTVNHSHPAGAGHSALLYNIVL